MKCDCGHCDTCIERLERATERAKARSKRARQNRKAKDSMLEDLGFHKATGALGGKYWE